MRRGEERRGEERREYCVPAMEMLLGSTYSTVDVLPKPGTTISTPGALSVVLVTLSYTRRILSTQQSITYGTNSSMLSQILKYPSVVLSHR